MYVSVDTRRDVLNEHTIHCVSNYWELLCSIDGRNSEQHKYVTLCDHYSTHECLFKN